MLEDVGTQHRADDDTAETVDVVNCYGIRKETIVCPHTSHHRVSNKEVSLGHRHIMLLRRLTLDEVKHGRRALHTEETTHQSADSAVASPYDGMRNGSIVMMKMPKPNPVVRWMKLAPMLNRKMEVTMLFIAITPNVSSDDLPTCYRSHSGSRLKHRKLRPLDCPYRRVVRYRVGASYQPSSL